MSNSDDLWISLHFEHPVTAAAPWTAALAAMEARLGATVTRLGERDRPPRRGARSLAELGAEVAAFGPQDSYRVCFGELEPGRLAVTFDHHRDPHPLILDSIMVVIPAAAPQRQHALDRLAPLLVDLAGCLRGSSGYVETLGRVMAKGPAVHPTVRADEELLGIFWLTWLGGAYVDRFGRDRVLALPWAEPQPGGAVLLRLGDSPDTVPEGRREEVEEYLGRDSFVDVNRTTRKPRGLHVPTYDQLRAWKPRA